MINKLKYDPKKKDCVYGATYHEIGVIDGCADTRGADKYSLSAKVKKI